MLVEKIAVAYWRLGRVLRAEVGEISERLLDWKQLVDNHPELDRELSERAISTTRLSLPSAEASDKILRYETTIDRRLTKAIDQLEQLQRRRQRENTLPRGKTAGGKN